MRATDWSRVDGIAAAVLARHDGVARIEWFLAAGLSRHQVAAMFRRGVIERPRLAWYVDPGLPWQGKHAVRVGGVLDCVSAAESWRIPVPPESWRRLHVRLTPNNPRLRHNRDRTWYVSAGEDHEVELHWTGTTTAPLGWRTSLVDTLLQLAGCVAEEWFVVALDAATHRARDGEPLLSDTEFTGLVGLLRGRPRAAVAMVDGRAESPMETLLRLALLRRGLGPFALQVQASPRHRVDLLLRGKLILEADGAAFHDPEADRLRDEELSRLGFRVLRFTYEQIVFDIEAVLDEIEAALLVL